jgi:hypothetical protein
MGALLAERRTIQAVFSLGIVSGLEKPMVRCLSLVTS